MLGNTDIFSPILVNFIQSAETSSNNPKPARGPGRPRGSKNKNPKPKVVVSGPKRKRGRPPGSGKRQREEGGGETDEANPPPAKRRGRPRKDQTSGGVVVDFGSMVSEKVIKNNSILNSMHQTVAGRPARPLPKRLGQQPTQATNPTRLHPIFGSAPEPTPTRRSDASGSMPAVSEHPQDPSRPPVVSFDPSERLQQTAAQGGEQNETPEAEDGPSLEDEANGEGIGDEDTLCGACSSEDDDIDPAVENMAPTDKPTTAGPKRARPARPEWFENVVKYMKGQAKDRNRENVPRAYWERKTIWLTHEDAWFQLKKSLPCPQDLYAPRFCCWDPIVLAPIPCPLCNAPLVRHGIIEDPRQIVDFDSNFFIIGYRYRCSKCTSSKAAGAARTFQSWDSRILKMLPPALAAEFPAILSRRSGMSIGLFDWMRSCFQSGMGPKQFSDSVRLQHLQRYDRLQRQYLQELVSRRAMDIWRGMKYSRFPSYDDCGPTGPCGFVPSGSWFCMMYKRFMNEHRNEIMQFISMLPLTVGSLDHSFKVCQKYGLTLGIGTEIFACSSSSRLYGSTARSYSLPYLPLRTNTVKYGRCISSRRPVTLSQYSLFLVSRNRSPSLARTSPKPCTQIMSMETSNFSKDCLGNH